MPLLQQYRDEQGGWAVWKTEEPLAEVISRLQNRDLVDEAKQRFTNEGKQHEWLCVRLLLQTVMGPDKKIEYLDSGKPLLTDGYYKISISHTKGYAALSYHKNREVGVDIERRGERVIKLRSRFLNPAEDAAVSPEFLSLSLLLHWSAKETVYKIVGRRLADFRESMTVQPFAVQRNGGFLLQAKVGAQKKEFRVNYLIHPDFVFTWAVE